MSEDIRQSGLNALEAALAGLKPSAPAFDRDALMFRAGQHSARRSAWPWPVLSAALALVAAGLGGLLAVRPTVQQVVIVEVEKPTAPEAAARIAPPPEPKVLPPPRERAVVENNYLRPWVMLVEGKATPAPLPPLYSPPTSPSLGGLLDLPSAALDGLSRSRLERAFSTTGEPL